MGSKLFQDLERSCAQLRRHRLQRRDLRLGYISAVWAVGEWAFQSIPTLLFSSPLACDNWTEAHTLFGNEPSWPLRNSRSPGL